jgi:hypothetical protein
VTPKPKIYLPNNAVVRLVPELAVEIGLNESILLLQIDFWISGCDHFQEGKYWTFQSVRKIKETFPYWGVATINRTIKSLEKKGLILVGKFNKHAYDKTRWFALNVDAISQLKTIAVVFQNGTAVYQNGTAPFQNETSPAQNGTTIPKIPPETTPKTNSAPDGAGAIPLKVINGSKSKPLTKRQKLLKQLEPFKDIAAAALELVDSGFTAGMDDPEHYMTVAHLEKYLPGLEDLHNRRATPEKLKALFAVLKPIYDAKGWVIGFNTLVEKYTAFDKGLLNGKSNGHTVTPAHRVIEPIADIELTPDEIEAIKAEARKVAS